MKTTRRDHPLLLGIEGGATRTTVLAVDARGAVVRRLEAGPANLRLMDDAALIRHLRAVRAAVPRPASLAIGMAGARTDADRQRLRAAAAKVWPGVPGYATNDLETALMAASIGERVARPARRAAPARPEPARVLVLSGTGSCCFGRSPAGRTVKVGGWGHILGDKGSGFEIGLRALKAVVYYYDREGVWSTLGSRLLRRLQLNEPDDLIGWVQQAGKTEIAALAVEVFAAWHARDRIATDILTGAAHSLARDAAACARRLVKAGNAVHFVLAGSVLLRQPRFARQVQRELKRLWPGARVTPLRRESVWGAVALAAANLNARVELNKAQTADVASPPAVPADVRALAASPTEQRNPRSLNLDKLPLGEAIALMLREDAGIPAAILAERKPLERAIQLTVRAFKRGGRLFYVGAGTSGRLGVLDASECPPTFQASPEMVQGIIAGGQRALWEAVEGAEDDPHAGARAIGFRGITRRDVVVGIAASGRTPFVWGALGEARRRGATTVLVTFNPFVEIARARRPQVVIAPNVGPEILTGSTRLKAGTATKLILNLLTTLAMVRLGKVLSNLMVDVKASNVKLRDRAARIVQELTGVDYATARAALEQSDWQIKAACRRLRRGQPRAR